MPRIVPTQTAQPNVYMSCQDLVNADKNLTDGDYRKAKHDLSEAYRLTNKFQRQAKHAQWSAQAARISVIAFTHILTQIACFAAACAPMLVATAVVLSPLATIGLVAICIVIAVALQLVAYFCILKKAHLSKLCTLIGIDELDKKAGRLKKKSAEIDLKISTLESEVRFSRLNATELWEIKKPRWDKISALTTKDPQNSRLQNVPPEIIAHIASYVIYAPLDGTEGDISTLVIEENDIATHAVGA